MFVVLDPGQPDGLQMDQVGNIFTISDDSVQVYAPDGTCLDNILVPRTVANLTFGGQKGERLIITAGHSLYAIDVNTHGA